MENFFNWIMKPISFDDVNNWISAQNMTYEKISLFFDIVMSLYYIVDDTYLDGGVTEISIQMSKKDKQNHFDWSWTKLISNFRKENIEISELGEHRDYLETFFWETYYDQTDVEIKNSIPIFFKNIFNMSKTFTKSDLDVLTEIYKIMDKNLVFSLTKI